MSDANNSLIPVFESTINDKIVQTVNARELHGFLEVKKDFSDWMKVQIERTHLVENRDYLKLPRKGEVINQRVTTNVGAKIEYHVVLRSAIHISLMSNTDKGHEIREYFIEIEDAYRNQESQFKIPKTLSEALQLAADQAKQIENQNEKIEVMTPKAEYCDQLLGSFEVFDGEQTAKMLRTSRSGLYTFLKQRGIITKSNLPMQLYIDKDFMRVRQTPYNDVFGNPKISLKVVFTQSGIHYIRMLFNEIMTHHQSATA